MLKIQNIENNTEQIAQQLSNRGLTDVAKLLDEAKILNKNRKATQKALEDLTHQLQAQTDAIAKQLKRQSNHTASITTLKAQLSATKADYKEKQARLKEYEKELRDKLAQLPNIPLGSVPIGQSAADNKVIKTWQPASLPKATPLPHWELVKKYDIVDFAAGNKITGAGFPVYKGKGAQLQRALINYFLAAATAQGYQEIAPPLLTNQDAAFGTGQLPDKEGMIYTLRGEDLYLIPTAEVPLTNLYRDTILEEKDLPIKLAAYTPCFRREAGSWGRHVRGLNRLHQFDKVEIVQIVAPAQYEIALQNMCTHVEKLLQALGLRYRMLQLCTGDLGFTAAITYDFEVWSPGQKQWLEVSSVSCFTTYQALRMQLRYKTPQGKQYCYTLNGSALALPRILSGLLETYQTPTAIQLPKVLHPYTSFQAI